MSDAQKSVGLESPTQISRRDFAAAGGAAVAVALAGWPGVKVSAASRSALFPDERIVSGAGFPAIAMFRRGDPAKPLVLFLPGGGHLGRIFYGHPESRSEDFVLTHLARAGFSTLALSYPSAHPALNRPAPDMTITQWAATVAAITAACIEKERLPHRVIAVGWSLGGRLARDLSLALRGPQDRSAIGIDIFVGLSGAPPLPGFGSLSRSDLQLTPEGLLDGSTPDSPVFRTREPHLKVIDAINGRTVLDRKTYAQLYVTDSPINFRGELDRYRDHRLVPDLADTIADQGSFDFENYPLCASIAATHELDMRYALTAASVWGMLSVQALYYQAIVPAVAKRKPEPRNWAQLPTWLNALIPRLSRHVEGSHFFFVGELGASATARYIQELATDAAAVRRELTALLS